MQSVDIFSCRGDDLAADRLECRIRCPLRIYHSRLLFENLRSSKVDSSHRTPKARQAQGRPRNRMFAIGWREQSTGPSILAGRWICPECKSRIPGTSPWKPHQQEADLACCPACLEQPSINALRRQEYKNNAPMMPFVPDDHRVTRQGLASLLLTLDVALCVQCWAKASKLMTARFLLAASQRHACLGALSLAQPMCLSPYCLPR